MNTKAHTGNQSVGMVEVDAQTDDEHEYVAVPRDWVESVESRLQELEAERDDLRERVDEAETKQSGFGAAINSNQNRIEDLEAGSGDENPTPEGSKTGSKPLNTVENDGSPLQQITNIPEYLADEQLSSNQERARFVAKDIKQYGDMRLGELVISSGDIRKVLSAKEEKSVHWQTVKRTIRYLDELGDDDTTVKDRHGTIVCFDPEAAEQYGRTNHAVVSGDKAEV